MSTTRRGLFLSFEGTDGSGKSTQLKMLVRRLRDSGYVVVQNIEPGGTAIGQQTRRILLDPANAQMDPTAELLLMFASRAQAAAELIRPALERGEIVISDRFTDASLAYQGAARGLGFEKVRELHRLAVNDLQPDLTVCIDIDVETSVARAQSRNSRSAAGTVDQSRFDEESLQFHRRVRQGYQRIAAEEPQRFRIVDGSGDPEAVAQRVWSIVEPALEALRTERSGLPVSH